MDRLIDVYRDRVTIAGQTVTRPSFVSVSQWFEFWDGGISELRLQEEYDRGYDTGWIEAERAEREV